MKEKEQHFRRQVPDDGRPLNINSTVQTVYFTIQEHVGPQGEITFSGRNSGRVMLNGTRRAGSNWFWNDAQSLVDSGDWVLSDPPANMILDEPPEEIQIDYSKLSDMPESSEGEIW